MDELLVMIPFRCSLCVPRDLVDYFLHFCGTLKRKPNVGILPRLRPRIAVTTRRPAIPIFDMGTSTGAKYPVLAEF
eukprot:1356566-Amorphochlora_amoeboformis.AAC.2